ncbi:Uncharacterised protein [uncultured archaeon]|nr:Uncharacterised protein [uncultured archaeon]
MAKQELTKAQKEKRRDIALKNLKGTVARLGVVYNIHAAKQDFGEAVNAALEQSVYKPALAEGASYTDPKTGEKVNPFASVAESARVGGQRYTGNVSELQAIQSCAVAEQESINYVTLQDLAGLVGYKGQVPKAIAGMYVEDAVSSKNPFAKKVAALIIGSYQQNSLFGAASKALGEVASKTSKGLEGAIKAVEQELAGKAA